MLYSKFYAGREAHGITFDKDGYADVKVKEKKMKQLKSFGIKEQDRPLKFDPAKIEKIEKKVEIKPEIKKPEIKIDEKKSGGIK